MDTFELCRDVNSLLARGDESSARNELIKLLANIEASEEAVYSPLLNRLIRDVGLYPYMDVETATWEDRFVFEAFKADVGEGEPITLHREQRRLLGGLLEGHSLAVSAPTSFGKSFVIDAFIAIKRPANVVILVPTIALADETRRRLQRKFGRMYNLVTTPDQPLRERNILIFPQERSIAYVRQISNVDILIVDEFYKASTSFDSERAPSLIRSIIEFSRLSKQRYFLAPNISALSDSEFTKGMTFVRLDFNTVFLEKHDLYKRIGRDEGRKSDALLAVLNENDGKSLIYAGTYSGIKRVANLLIDRLDGSQSRLLSSFQQWLAKHYELNWDLTRLVSRGAGVHNGQLHRSLSQIQIRLFEEQHGLEYLISTSSIIEGVNTSAKNVILWSNKNGQAKLKDFTYRNIIGRGGRMFRHFVGKIFILEPPPDADETQLNLTYPDELLGVLDDRISQIEYTPEQVAAIQHYERQMGSLVGPEQLSRLQSEGLLFSSDTELILRIASDLKKDRPSWNGMKYLNSDDPETWDRILYKLIQLDPSAWECPWKQFVAFVKTLSSNWRKSVPELLYDLSAHDIGIDEFFKLERIVSFRLGPLLSDVQTIHNAIYEWDPVQLSPAISKFSHAFLPKLVCQLEEYGLPRMISRKICARDLIDLEGDRDLQSVIADFRLLGPERLIGAIPDLDNFDEYVIRYFFEGIVIRQERNPAPP